MHGHCSNEFLRQCIPLHVQGVLPGQSHSTATAQADVQLHVDDVSHGVCSMTCLTLPTARTVMKCMFANSVGMACRLTLHTARKALKSPLAELKHALKQTPSCKHGAGIQRSVRPLHHVSSSPVGQGCVHCHLLGTPVLRLPPQHP